MKYMYLTQEQRYQIYAFSKVNWAQKSIAEEVGVHKKYCFARNEKESWIAWL